MDQQLDGLLAHPRQLGEALGLARQVHHPPGQVLFLLDNDRTCCVGFLEAVVEHAQHGPTDTRVLGHERRKPVGLDAEHLAIFYGHQRCGAILPAHEAHFAQELTRSSIAQQDGTAAAGLFEDGHPPVQDGIKHVAGIALAADHLS